MSLSCRLPRCPPTTSAGANHGASPPGGGARDVVGLRQPRRQTGALAGMLGSAVLDDPSADKQGGDEPRRGDEACLSGEAAATSSAAARVGKKKGARRKAETANTTTGTRLNADGSVRLPHGPRRTLHTGTQLPLGWINNPTTTRPGRPSTGSLRPKSSGAASMQAHEQIDVDMAALVARGWTPWPVIKIRCARTTASVCRRSLPPHKIPSCRAHHCLWRPLTTRVHAIGPQPETTTLTLPTDSSISSSASPSLATSTTKDTAESTLAAPLTSSGPKLLLPAAVSPNLN
ncbi:hypothetical protein ACCO45_004058 [Purpureocillium lilacinum]|uniref:Uncharacterized protein n=1 Tax=Purpureocillium lilacinum TaxID=33203 RepID=A0ACC4E1N2_PURLI